MDNVTKFLQENEIGAVEHHQEGHGFFKLVVFENYQRAVLAFLIKNYKNVTVSSGAHWNHITFWYK